MELEEEEEIYILSDDEDLGAATTVNLTHGNDSARNQRSLYFGEPLDSDDERDNHDRLSAVASPTITNPPASSTKRTVTVIKSAQKNAKSDDDDDDFGPSKPVKNATAKPQRLISKRKMPGIIKRSVNDEDDDMVVNFFDRSKSSTVKPSISTENRAISEETIETDGDDSPVKRGRKRMKKSASAVLHDMKPVINLDSDTEFGNGEANDIEGNNNSDDKFAEKNHGKKKNEILGRERSLTPPPIIEKVNNAELKRPITVLSESNEDLEDGGDFELDPELQKLKENFKPEESPLLETVDVLISAYSHPENLDSVKPMKIHIHSKDCLELPMKKFCELRKLSFDNMVFLFNGTILSRFANCRSLKIGSSKKISIDAMTSTFYYNTWKKMELEKRELTLHKQEEAAQENDKNNSLLDDNGSSENMITLKMNMKGKIETIRTGRNTKISALMAHCKSIRNLSDSTIVKIKFDGEQLQPDDTLNDADIDDEDQVDVTFA